MKRMPCIICLEYFDTSRSVSGSVCSDKCLSDLKARNKKRTDLLTVAQSRISVTKLTENVLKHPLPKKIKRPKVNLSNFNETIVSKNKKRKKKKFNKIRSLERIVRAQSDQIRALKNKPSTFKQISNHPFYGSREWRSLRYKIIKLQGRKCNLCGSTQGRLHVDHIKPRSKYPHLELQESNLQVLCEDCNLGKSNKDETDWRKNS